MASTIGIGAEYAAGRSREQLTGGRRDHSGRIFQLLLWLSLGFSLGVLAVLFYDVLIEGVGVFSTRAESFLSGGLRSSAAASGIFQAIKGTFWIGVFVVVLSFPIGVASAVYLEEYATKGAVRAADRREHPEPRGRAVDRLRHPRSRARSSSRWRRSPVERPSWPRASPWRSWCCRS